MKKILIGSFVGAIILFLWGFLAWDLLPIHLHTIMYTPAQDSILKVLETSHVETGAYFMPTVDNRNVSGFDAKYHEQTEKMMKENAGKPIASVYYIKEGYDMGGGIILKGFLFYFIAMLAATIILMPGFTAMRSFFGRWWLTLLVGLLLSAAGPLLNYTWLGIPLPFTLDMVMDLLVSWGLAGLWLAWYFRKKNIAEAVKPA